MLMTPRRKEKLSHYCGYYHLVCVAC